jgi:hypothetical protein
MKLIQLLVDDEDADVIHGEVKALLEVQAPRTGIITIATIDDYKAVNEAWLEGAARPGLCRMAEMMRTRVERALEKTNPLK